MAYADNLEIEGTNSQYLVVMRPRRFMDTTAWTLVSATIYKQAFDYGVIIAVDEDGEAKDEATSTALSDGDWFFDGDDLYLDIGADPANSDIVSTYIINISTDSYIYHYDPSDTTTSDIDYEPIIENTPDIVQGATDNLYGFLASQSGSLSVSNTEKFFQRHVYDSSFYQANIDIYHLLGDLQADNIKLVYSGLVTNINTNDARVRFKLIDRLNIFDKEFRNANTSFYTTSISSLQYLDPVFENRPIRKIYGVVDGYPLVSISYDDPVNDSLWYGATSVNNTTGTIFQNVSVAPASTATRTYLDSADGIRAGDGLIFTDGINPNQQGRVDFVNKTGSHYVDHDAISFPLSGVGSDTVRRSVIPIVYIKQNDVIYYVPRGQHYFLWYVLADGYLSARFFSSVSPAVIPNPLSSTDTIWARAYGEKNTTTLGGSPFGGDSTETGNLTQGIVILFQLLKDAGIPEADIDLTTFQAFQTSITTEISFAVPANSTDQFPKYKDVIGDILRTLNLKLFLNDDNKWSIKETAPMVTEDKTATDIEIIGKNISYNFDYNDIVSDVFAEHNYRETNVHGNSWPQHDRQISTSTVAQRLHKVDKQATFSTLHLNAAEAQTYADRMRYIFGDRQAFISFVAKHEYFGTEIGDVIKLIRSRLPGFDFDSAIDRERMLSVITTRKSLNEIIIELSDYKGMQDNSASW